VIERLDKQRKDKESYNEAVKLHNVQRRDLMKQQSEQRMAERNTKIEQRWQVFEDSQIQFQNDLHRKREERKQRAAEKLESIKKAVQRANALIDARAAKAYEKEAHVAELMKIHDEERKDKGIQHEQEEEVKNERRKIIYEESVKQHHEKAVTLSHKIDHAEKRLRDIRAENESQRRQKHEVAREKEIDKMESIHRWKLIEQQKINKLEGSIDDKGKRVDRMRDQQEQLKLKRKHFREEAERNRVVVVETTPGPGDYDISKPLGTDQPKWRFGLPASAMGPRTISREQAPSGGADLPGPCAYYAETGRSSRLANHPTFSFAKHERWSAA